MRASILQVKTKSWGKEIIDKIQAVYSEEWRLWEVHYQQLFFIALMVFMISAVAGYAYYHSEPEKAHSALEKLKNQFLRDHSANESALIDFLRTFWNNLRLSFLTILGGWIPFLCLSLYSTVVNGKAFGLVFLMLQQKGYNLFTVFVTGILPHGILEIPGFLYANCLGIYLSLALGKKIWRKLNYSQTLSIANEELIAFHILFRSFMRVSIPLLLIAAFIEAFITPLFFGAAFPRFWPKMI